jgi:hypothetical protein
MEMMRYRPETKVPGIKRAGGLLLAAEKEVRDAGAGDGVAATVRVANVIATASGDAQTGQNRAWSGASAPHSAQRIILCILPHSFAVNAQLLVRSGLTFPGEMMHCKCILYV